MKFAINYDETQFRKEKKKKWVERLMNRNADFSNSKINQANYPLEKKKALHARDAPCQSAALFLWIENQFQSKNVKSETKPIASDPNPWNGKLNSEFSFLPWELDVLFAEMKITNNKNARLQLILTQKRFLAQIGREPPKSSI